MFQLPAMGEPVPTFDELKALMKMMKKGPPPPPPMTLVGFVEQVFLLVNANAK